MKKLFTYLGLSAIFVLGACSSEGADAEPESFPNDNIELVAPATPGGGWDATARAIQKILDDEGIVEENINVVNKPGGSGEVGWQYTKEKDAHTVAIDSSLLITNNLLGQSELSYEDLTPLAILTTEWISIAVPNDSPFEDATELMEQLKKDPTSIKIALAPGLGNNDHLSFVQAAKEFGVDVTKLNILIYESGGDVVTALLGNHVDVATMSVSESKEQHLAKNFKIISVSSEERLEGLEEVQTWKEQGIDMVFPHWRGIVGPPDMTEEEIAYYDDAIAKMVETEAWKTLLKNNDWLPFYKNSAETSEFLKVQTENYDKLLTDSGLTD
ncbi:tripartite tricarboxylate transporter substrate binding protein [Paenisporosarcina antarctica]|uniref:Tripartite tricarboxylate transporter substrate binding protein n=1 Tax=Paenisporosarcina antarctica TaxID=417367 RepID=A0A4P7A1Y3_9BACL|nr:tripartite tricarboxylate transporter substrate binding protein [Paenisporosarcina antarctica]QBP42723.1 tripartite tricarboxylate transporter substrate binding protein [Paenisporosarcina antarctica]